MRFRDELRQARAATARNAESFAEIVRVVERMARFRGARGNGMGGFFCTVEEMAGASPLAVEVPELHAHYLEPFAVLYESTRLGRNLAVHEGAYARNVARHAVEMALILEDAMQAKMNLVKHFMVRSPTCAELWEPVAHVRQKMLANAFSFLPVWLDSTDEWALLSDRAVAKYVRREKRNEALAASIEKAIEDGLTPDPAETIGPGEPLAGLVERLDHRPVLVIHDDRPSELLGIITAFDIL